MRILLVANFFPPEHTAGTENYSFGLARALLNAGHQINVLCAGTWNEGPHYWNRHQDDVCQGIPVRRLHLNWVRAPDPNRYLYDNPRVAGFFNDYLNELRPDIVHVTSCYTLSASVIKTAQQAGIPVVLTLTDFWFVCPSVNLLRSNGELCDGRVAPFECLECIFHGSRVFRLLSWLPSRSARESILTSLSNRPRLSRLQGLRGMALDVTERRRVLQEMLCLSDWVIAPSHFLAEMYIQYGCRVPIHIQPSGQDLSWLNSYSGKKPSATIRFGYLGQVKPHKGVHILLEAFQQLPCDDPVSLSIFGKLSEPEYTKELHQIAGSHPRISFKTPLPHEQVGEAFSTIDFLVVPSLCYENNPLVIQEAFASNTPVIASKLGGMSEFVKDEENGLLFEAGNARVLAEKLYRLVHEPGLRARLQEGIPRVKEMSHEIRELEGVYAKLLGQI